MTDIYQPVSLGNTCETKFQLARTLHFRRHPRASIPGFRVKMLPPDRGKQAFGWEIFDWNGTPFRALRAYLESDFQGVFGREDLEPSPDGHVVMHRTLGSQFLHEFERLTTGSDPSLTHEKIDQAYASALSTFERGAKAFRRKLETPGRFLYVYGCEDIPPAHDVKAILDLLTARSPEHEAHMLVVGYEDEDNDLSSLAGRVTKAYRPRVPTDKPADRYWEGDDTAWDAALAPFRLAFPDGQLAEPVEAATPAAPEPQRSGLLSRLFGR